VDHRRQVRDFLVSRCAKITPDRAGLAAYGRNRRVPGLRREEVAMLAGVSVDYYTRLEKGNLAGVSERVLDAVARTLHLDDVECAHLHRASSQPQVRPGAQRLLDAMPGVAAFLRTGRLDVLAANGLGHTLYSPVFSTGCRAASTLPAMLLAARRVLADAFDRRWLVLTPQAYFSVGLLLTVLTAMVLTAAGHVPSALLLAFTFALGPRWPAQQPGCRAMMPELVPRSQLRAASRLDLVNVNVSAGLGRRWPVWSSPTCAVSRSPSP
jgi:transcriptional regulator with XRE-family HTH domain